MGLKFDMGNMHKLLNKKDEFLKFYCWLKEIDYIKTIKNLEVICNNEGNEICYSINDKEIVKINIDYKNNYATLDTVFTSNFHADKAVS